MKKTITELFKFQEFYLLQILDNIPESKLYVQNKKSGNSPGWIMGHLIVEIEELFDVLKIETEKIDTNLFLQFKGGGSIKNNDPKLPSKQELIALFTKRYNLLLKVYLEMDESQREKKHPSKMLSDIYSTIDAWVLHHLITHVAVHIGNISIWKKINAIKVEGL